MITGIHVRLGRTALGWGVRDLAAAAKVSPATVTRIENGDKKANATTLFALQSVMEQAGVIFIMADDGGGPGVRLARSPDD